MTQRLLVVEDRDGLRRMMRHALDREGYHVVAVEDAAAGMRCLRDEPFDFVVTDLKLPGGSGLEVVAAAREHQPQTPVVVLTAFGTVDHAVEAMKLGAVDFLEKPLELTDLFELIRAYTDGEVDRGGLSLPDGSRIVGNHPTLRAALRLLRKVAPTASTVLLTGESGTGKELFARALHAQSPRADRPFVAVNCAAIPEALMENELFGHERGAFTGAARRQAGRFELAAGGTLFLDEIGELPAAMQGKILRVLEERTFERVGGGREIRADVRLIAATNRDLEAMSRDGRFRSDLYFRLDVFPIALPPLRDRASDVPALARHLIAAISARLGRMPPVIASAAETFLAAQPWPGNVRELANLLERVLILENAPRLEVAHLRAVRRQQPGDDEPALLRRALEDTGGDKQAAAERLGVSYRTLQRKIKAFDLEGFPKYRR